MHVHVLRSSKQIRSIESVRRSRKVCLYIKISASHGNTGNISCRDALEFKMVKGEMFTVTESDAMAVFEGSCVSCQFNILGICHFPLRILKCRIRFVS